jgi:branched-chain amino acid transport system substrate-binding protein
VKSFGNGKLRFVIKKRGMEMPVYKSMTDVSRRLTVITTLAVALTTGAFAAEPVKMGIVVFLSGPAAGPVGIPSRNAAEIVIEAINAGKLPAPYDTAGLGGAKIEAKIIDEAGNTAAVVTEYRNLVQRDGAKVVVGYFSSANCLATAPLADELRTLTVIYGCGAKRLFEDAQYKYVFRPTPHTTSDNVAAARYIVSKMPNLKSYSGINQNYSWGLDNWEDFVLAMKALAPSSAVDKALLPKLFAGEYSSEISALLISGSSFIHSSFWDGDLESFVIQSVARGLAQRTPLLLTVGEQMLFRRAAIVPDGAIIGARGAHGLLAHDNPLNNWFVSNYEARFGTQPNFPAYHMFQTLLGVKAAWDKAASANKNSAPTGEEISAAFRHLEFATASGPIKMAIGNGAQGIQSVALGTYRYNKAAGKPELIDVAEYPAECVNPPDGVTATEWLQKGMPGAKCQ